MINSETVTILLPSRGRAAQLRACIQGLLASVEDRSIRHVGRSVAIEDRIPGHKIEIVVILDASDPASFEAMRGLPVTVVSTGRDFTTAVEKYNLGYPVSTGEWIVSGADDLMWYDGWLEAALTTDNDGWVGFNDGHTQQVGFATHGMVRREVVDRCMAGYFTLPWYKSWYGDFEARARLARGGVRYVIALDALVEHRHPIWGTASEDDTYRLGARFHGEDLAEFNRRSALGFPDDLILK